MSWELQRPPKRFTSHRIKFRCYGGEEVMIGRLRCLILVCGLFVPLAVRSQGSTLRPLTRLSAVQARKPEKSIEWVSLGLTCM